MARRLPSFQLAAQLDSYDYTAPDPPASWVDTIRSVVGLNFREFVARLELPRASAARLVLREQTGDITLRQLRAAAKAFGCTLEYTFVPETSFTGLAKKQLRFVNDERRQHRKGPLRAPATAEERARWEGQTRFGRSVLDAQHPPEIMKD